MGDVALVGCSLCNYMPAIGLHWSRLSSLERSPVMLVGKGFHCLRFASLKVGLLGQITGVYVVRATVAVMAKRNASFFL